MRELRRGEVESPAVSTPATPKSNSSSSRGRDVVMSPVLFVGCGKSPPSLVSSFLEPDAPSEPLPGAGKAFGSQEQETKDLVADGYSDSLCSKWRSRLP